MADRTLNQIIDQAYSAKNGRSQLILDLVRDRGKTVAGGRRDFLEETATQYGAAYIDDDADILVITVEALVDLLTVIEGAA